MELIDFLALAFSAFGIACTVTTLSGPANVFGRLRRLAGAEAHADGVPGIDDEWEAPVMIEDGSIAELFSCPYCFSFYGALISLACWWLFQPLLILLAVYGAALLIVDVTQ